MTDLVLRVFDPKDPRGNNRSQLENISSTAQTKDTSGHVIRMASWDSSGDKSTHHDERPSSSC